VKKLGRRTQALRKKRRVKQLRGWARERYVKAKQGKKTGREIASENEDQGKDRTYLRVTARNGRTEMVELWV